MAYLLVIVCLLFIHLLFTSMISLSPIVFFLFILANFQYWLLGVTLLEKYFVTDLLELFLPCLYDLPKVFESFLDDLFCGDFLSFWWRLYLCFYFVVGYFLLYLLGYLPLQLSKLAYLIHAHLPVSQVQLDIHWGTLLVEPVEHFLNQLLNLQDLHWELLHHHNRYNAILGPEVHQLLIHDYLFQLLLVHFLE